MQTSGNGLRFYWNEHGTNNWHGEQVAANGTTFSDAVHRPGRQLRRHRRAGRRQQPGLLLAGERRHRLEHGGRGRAPGRPTPHRRSPRTAPPWSSRREGPATAWPSTGRPTSTAAWNPEIVAGAGTTFSAPAQAVNGNSVNIAAEGPSNSLRLLLGRQRQPHLEPRKSWPAPGTTTSAPAMVAQGGGVNIVARRYNTVGLVSYWAVNGSATWTPSGLAGEEAGGQPSMVAYPGNPGGVHVVAVGGFLGGVAEETSVNGSGSWQEALVCGGCSLLGQRMRARRPDRHHERRPGQHGRCRCERQPGLLVAGQFRHLAPGNRRHRHQPVTRRRAGPTPA